MRKGEIACTCNKQFLLFSQCFVPYLVLIFHCTCTLNKSAIDMYWYLTFMCLFPKKWFLRHDPKELVFFLLCFTEKYEGPILRNNAANSLVSLGKKMEADRCVW